MTVNVERLYELCEKLDEAKEKIADRTEDYQAIINGAKGGANEKRLSSQLIVRYFHQLPDQQLRALDALFQLCEDDDVNIRKLVIKELPSLCKSGKDEPQHVDKVGDVLTQLLQTEDIHEQTTVQKALVFLLNKWPQETLKTIFGHVVNADEDLIRERAVKFLAAKLKSLPAALMTRDLENFILTETKKVLQDVSGDEFVLFMFILGNLPHLQTVTGRQQLLDIVMEQADMEKNFDPSDPDRVDQIIQCFKHAIPYLSKNVHSTKMINFLLEKVMPSLDKIAVENTELTQLELLRVMAELSAFAGELDNANDKIDPIFKKLLAILPPPASETNGSVPSADLENEDPKFKFSEIETLLWTFHQLAKANSSFFVETHMPDEKKEFKKRLQILARTIQDYSKKLTLVLSKKSPEDRKSEENKIKYLALRTTSNIQLLVRDFMRPTPLLKTALTLSWKPLEKENAQKRRSLERDDIEVPSRKTVRKEERSVYAPPSGKFSEKAGAYEGQDEGWQRGGNFRRKNRGRGGRFRGRGRQW